MTDYGLLTPTELGLLSELQSKRAEVAELRAVLEEAEEVMEWANANWYECKPLLKRVRKLLKES